MPFDRRRREFALVLVAALACGDAAAAPAKRRKPAARAAQRKPSSRPLRRVSYDLPGYADRPEVQAFVADVAARRALDPRWLIGQLAQARPQELVQRLIMPAASPAAKNWAAYRERFVEPRRIEAGVQFWQAHEAWLRRAEEQYGVPPAIVVGVIGVETFYGRVTGGFRVLDALATLAFDFPAGRSDRSAFFRAELEELLVLAQRQGVDAATWKGSYAGAIGLPQFMPGSINRHAVDFDGDGRVDLQGSAADSIGSVAKFLAAHGWQRDLPTHHEVVPPSDAARRAQLLVPDIVPSFGSAQFEELGARLDDAGKAHAGPLALVELRNGDAAPSYVAGTANFYALTRYNWSAYYAMAVIELGEAVRRQR